VSSILVRIATTTVVALTLVLAAASPVQGADTRRKTKLLAGGFRTSDAFCRRSH